jgi:hypothetical protein
MAYHQLRRLIICSQPIGGIDQVLHVRRKIRISEISFTISHPGKIESQHSNSLSHQTA